MNRVFQAIALVGLIAASLWYFQPIELGTLYHCGVCGTQKYERHFFGLDLTEEDDEEYSIRERWTQAHEKPCQHLWVRGSLEDDGAYWPKLHFLTAIGQPIAELEKTIDATSTEALRKKDKLGRTVLHWLVIHPDRHGRQHLIDKLVNRGLSLDEKDGDGLSPRDWEKRAATRY
jgi:hypothetical protein